MGEYAGAGEQSSMERNGGSMRLRVAWDPCAYQSLLQPSDRCGMPRLAFLPCLPPARPLYSTPPHPSPSTLAHPQPCSHLSSHLCPRPGTAAEPAAPGCGLQPAGETQGAGTAVAADRAAQGEDQAAGFVPSSPRAELVSPLTHIRRLQAHLSHLFLCPALPGGEPFVVPP